MRGLSPAYGPVRCPWIPRSASELPARAPGTGCRSGQSWRQGKRADGLGNRRQSGRGSSTAGIPGADWRQMQHQRTANDIPGQSFRHRALSQSHGPYTGNSSSNSILNLFNSVNGTIDLCRSASQERKRHFEPGDRPAGQIPICGQPRRWHRGAVFDRSDHRRADIDRIGEGQYREPRQQLQRAGHHRHDPIFGLGGTQAFPWLQKIPAMPRQESCFQAIAENA